MFGELGATIGGVRLRAPGPADLRCGGGPPTAEAQSRWADVRATREDVVPGASSDCGKQSVGALAGSDALAVLGAPWVANGCCRYDEATRECWAALAVQSAGRSKWRCEVSTDGR